MAESSLSFTPKTNEVSFFEIESNGFKLAANKKDKSDPDRKRFNIIAYQLSVSI